MGEEGTFLVVARWFSESWRLLRPCLEMIGFYECGSEVVVGGTIMMLSWQMMSNIKSQPSV